MLHSKREQPMKIEVLYKYRAWDINTIKIIANSELYYASPLKFNDPFDFRITPRTNCTDDEWRTWLTERVGAQEADNLVRQRNHQSPDFHRKIRDDMVRRQGDSGVLCLSRKRDDILMWSHYADSHKGVCLEFQWDVISEPIEEVNYSQEMPIIRVCDPDYSDRVKEFIITKSVQWIYEEEVRVIKPNQIGLHRFPPRWLSGVIMGCCMPDPERLLLQRLRASMAPHVQLWEAQMKENEFALDVVRV